MKYPNLIAEMARLNINENDIAFVAQRSIDTVRNWLKGKGEFPIGIALEVQAKFFPTYSITYLFSTEPIMPEIKE